MWSARIPPRTRNHDSGHARIGRHALHGFRPVRGGLSHGLFGSRRWPAVGAPAGRLHQLRLVRSGLPGRGTADGWATGGRMTKAHPESGWAFGFESNLDVTSRPTPW